MSERWDRHFLGMALYHARMSKDPSTRVGAVIVGPDRELIAAGFNGFPRGIADTPERLNNRELKYQLVVHAEMNAALYAARKGVALKGSSMYLAAYSYANGRVWGGAPCNRCTVELIQAGIDEVVSYPLDDMLPPQWKASCHEGEQLLAEAGIKFRILPRGPELSVVSLPHFAEAA